MKILQAVSVILLGSTAEFFEAVQAALYLVGLWAIFQKSGVKGWWTLVP